MNEGNDQEDELDIVYRIDDTPPWYVSITLGFQVWDNYYVTGWYSAEDTGCP